MKNNNLSSFKEILPKIDDKGNIISNDPITEKEFTIVKRYDKNSSSSQSAQKAEDLFSSFTANIIKEETLFIR